MSGNSQQTPSAPVKALSDAYRSTRRQVALLCGIALAWSMAMLDFSEASLPLTGSASLSLKALPAVFGAMITYQLIICTIEYMMQPVDIRRWKLAQADFRITVILCTLSLYLLAWSFVSRSFVSAIRVLGCAIIGLASFLLMTSTVVCFSIAIIMLNHRIRYERPPSVAPTCMKAMIVSLLISVPVFVGTIIKRGPRLLTMGCKYLGLAEPPNTTEMWLFIISFIVIVLGYLLVESFFMNAIFALPIDPFMPGAEFTKPELVRVTVEPANIKMTTDAPTGKPDTQVSHHLEN